MAAQRVTLLCHVVIEKSVIGFYKSKNSQTREPQSSGPFGGAIWRCTSAVGGQREQSHPEGSDGNHRNHKNINNVVSYAGHSRPPIVMVIR